MDKLHGVLAVVAGLAVCAGLAAARDALRWNQRAVAAEAFAKAQGDSATAWEKRAVELASQAAEVDTVRVKDIALLPAVDAKARPDSTCAPSLNARDAIIAESIKEVADLDAEVRAQRAALVSLTLARDTLKAVLGARPRLGALTLELLHPRLNLALAQPVLPYGRPGLVISVNVVSFRL